MIYLFSGDDTKNKLASYEKFIKSLSTQVGLPKDIGIFSVNRNNFDPIQIESLYSGSSLFSPVCVVIFQNIFEYEETRDFVLDKMKLMVASSNYFIFLEGKLSKPILDSFKKLNTEINIFELPKEKINKFDTFKVANAFANKDKLNTWIYFREGVDSGVSLEEITGVIFWKIKDMILKKNFSKYTLEQLKNFASKVSYILSESRKNGMDAEATLEQFLLEVF